MMKINIFNKVLLVGLVLANTVCLMATLLEKMEANILIIIACYGLCFLPLILKKIKMQIPSIVETLYWFFVILSCLLGSIINLYDKIYWFDSLVHYISGILSGLVSFMLLIKFNKLKEKDYIFNILFIISITLTIASFWEFFEFFCNKILNGDPQKVLKTGVTDTMKDMICALLGSILISFMYCYEYINDKKMLIHKFIKNI